MDRSRIYNLRFDISYARESMFLIFDWIIELYYTSIAKIKTLMRELKKLIVSFCLYKKQVNLYLCLLCLYFGDKVLIFGCFNNL